MTLQEPSVKDLLILINQNLASTSFLRDILPLMIAVVVALFGWYIQARRDRNNRIEDYKNKISYEIYKEITRIYDVFIEKSTKLNNISAPPLILMESCLILGKVTKNHSDIIKGHHEAVQKWLNFVNDSFAVHFDFSSAWRSFLAVYEDWESVLAGSKLPFTIASSEVEKLKSDVYEYLQYLQKLDPQNWQKWDKNEINGRANQIFQESLSQPIYVYDLMVIIHNELVGKFFGHSRPLRRPQDLDSFVLTKKGLIRARDLPSMK